MQHKLPKTYTHHLPNGVSFDLILVKAGCFIMGSEDEEAFNNEKPEHIVHITKDFYISKYPVTQEVWPAVSQYDLPEQSFTGKHRPITNVSWTDICEGNQDKNGRASFLDEINQTPFSEAVKEQFSDLGLKFNLPTEAQWEYAAKGGHLSSQEDLEHKKSADLYHPYANSRKLKEVAWFKQNSHRETKNVGQKKANALGLYDLSGNVWEWCYDEYDSDFYKKSKAENLADPFNLGKGDNWRLLRGGAWNSAPQDCRVSSRYRDPPSYRNSYIGFRLVLSSFSLGG